MLQHLHRGALTPPGNSSRRGGGGGGGGGGSGTPRVAAGGKLLEFDQGHFIPAPYTSASSALQQTGLVFVPDACQAAAGCRLHVALHGCEQTREQVGDAFAQHAGYLPWAAANGIVVLFPQVKTTLANPKGCFDWWGYTGVDYACKLAAQVRAVSAMLDRLLGPLPF